MSLRTFAAAAFGASLLFGAAPALAHGGGGFSGHGFVSGPRATGNRIAIGQFPSTVIMAQRVGRFRRSFTTHNRVQGRVYATGAPHPFYGSQARGGGRYRGSYLQHSYFGGSDGEDRGMLPSCDSADVYATPGGRGRLPIVIYGVRPDCGPYGGSDGPGVYYLR